NLVVNFGNLQFSENLNAAEITIKNRKNLVVTLTDSLQPKTLYAASVKLFDCAQNAGFEELVYFALPETPEKNDLVINEVLSNPRKSICAYYIEIYNIPCK